jgi:hypothetical protein
MAWHVGAALGRGHIDTVHVDGRPQLVEGWCGLEHLGPELLDVIMA